MDESKNKNVSVPALVVLYDFQYTAKDKREISMRKGEKLYLLEKTNKDWWQVVRQSERRSFYVPAQYVEVISKEKIPLEHVESGIRRREKVEYENVNPMKGKNQDRIENSPGKHHPTSESVVRSENESGKSTQIAAKKPVPKTRTKVSSNKQNYDFSIIKNEKKMAPEEEKPEGGKHADVTKPDSSLSLPKNSEELSLIMEERENTRENKNTSDSDRFRDKSSSNIKSKAIAGSEEIQGDINKNRMKSSYNLKVKPSKSFEFRQRSPSRYGRKESLPAMNCENPNLSKSLEKLAQEIKFQPKDGENQNPPEKTHCTGVDGSCRQLTHKSEEPDNNYNINSNNSNKNNNNNVNNNVIRNDNDNENGKNQVKKGQKGEEQVPVPQSRGSVFSRIRRSLHHNSSFKSNNLKKFQKGDKKACELSLSWEGGLDKALELEKNKKPQLASSALQRSRTFMVAERSPTVFKHPSSMKYARNRVDIAYHSQKPTESKKVLLSTFKPINKIDEFKQTGENCSKTRLDRKINANTEKVKDWREKSFPKDCGRKKTFSEDRGSLYENIISRESETTSQKCVKEDDYCSRDSDSEDNSEVQSFPSVSVEKTQEKGRKPRNSIDSNMTQSEGTELSESDDNGSLDLNLETRSKVKEPLNKRRTSLMRNRRVSAVKTRSVTTKQLPPTPGPEERSTKDLGDGWGVYHSSDNRTYYYNVITEEKSWKPPRRNLSRQENRYVGSRESICSDTSGSVIRSSTSSPSNDRILSNSLNRSNASTSSRSTCYDVSGYDITKSSSGCNLKEDSAQLLNRSSLNSSPAICQSRSSSYSLIKSSRDSLNRCSPIENIPSEEDDIELNDHVYHEEGVKGEFAEPLSEEETSQTGDGKDTLQSDEDKPTTGMVIPPGWTEHYDDATSQFFYVHKGTKQKVVTPKCISPDIKLRKMCYKYMEGNEACHLGDGDDPFEEIITGIDNDIYELEKRMIAFEKKELDLISSSKNLNLYESNSWRHTLPPNFFTSAYSVYDNLSLTTVKPPLPPRTERNLRRSKSLPRKNRPRRQQLTALLQVLQSIDETCKKNEQMRSSSNAIMENDKPLPFPVMEPVVETQDLLLFQRVTDSLKERRRANNERRVVVDCQKEEKFESDALGNRRNLSPTQREILERLQLQLRRNRETEDSPKLREDVIIDWENNYDNLVEPVVLEGKSLYSRRVHLSEEWMSAAMKRCDSPTSESSTKKSVRFKESDSEYIEPTSEEELSDDSKTNNSKIRSWDNCGEFDKSSCDKISVSSMSDYEDTLTTYSDFESDINEAIHLGESWCNEECSEDESEETQISNLTGIGSCVDVSAAESISKNAAGTAEIRLKRCSDPSLIRNHSEEELRRTKSADFFSDSLTDLRIRHPDRCDSIRSDVAFWMSRTRGMVYVEDKYTAESDCEEWFTSFDPEGRLYFFDELSNESSWALPDVSGEGGDSKYPIQRSATESAIPKDERAAADGEKRRSRVTSSARSSKTQSMVIEPKLDFSPKDDNKTQSMPRDLTKIYGEIIRSGMLNKTKISENGKKLRKNWTPAFAVLSNTKLLFFKDAKTFHSMKPANDCMCLNLKGAVIEKGDKISSKRNVYKINSTDQTDVLIQTDRTCDAEEWFKDISSVINNLPQESIDTSTSSLDPNSPSKVGRTKSVKARTKDSGSMEDLSLNPEERQNKIKAKLKKFFHRRPTVDSLKKKGIWKDEPVFGCSLEQITKNRNPRVPVFVEKCVECIESKEENMKTDGLYRASGNLSQVQKIRLEVDQNNLSVMYEEEDVHVLTGSLKLFFRELKDPLIPFKQLVPALTAINNPKRKEKIREYRKIVGTLPGPNYDTLKFLLQHLLRVEKYNEFNRMNVNNLAIVFGPTLMWPEQESTNMALDFMQQNLVIECLLREFQEIFT